jgi:hypothetical protein
MCNYNPVVSRKNPDGNAHFADVIDIRIAPWTAIYLLVDKKKEARKKTTAKKALKTEEKKASAKAKASAKKKPAEKKTGKGAKSA